MDPGPSRRRAVHLVNEPATREVPQSTDYRTSYAGTDVPIVLDNGSSRCFVGDHTETETRLLQACRGCVQDGPTSEIRVCNARASSRAIATGVL